MNLTQPSIIKEMKRSIVEMSVVSGEGHIPSALSILDILWVLYTKILRINANNPLDFNRDRFILSKGHGSLALYAVLAEKGFFDKKELNTFGQFNSILGGHPDCNKIPRVEASTGSLGHGFPIALGIALGLKIKKSKASVFVLVGDGECNEGSIWETALLASHHQLSNFCCIVDYNHSTDRALLVGNLVAKFEAFGWKTVSINGHDHSQIKKVLSNFNNNGPLAIIANTIKGYGCRMMENNPAWHHRSPNNEELEEILKELK